MGIVAGIILGLMVAFQILNILNWNYRTVPIDLVWSVIIICVFVCSLTLLWFIILIQRHHGATDDIVGQKNLTEALEKWERNRNPSIVFAALYLLLRLGEIYQAGMDRGFYFSNFINVSTSKVCFDLILFLIFYFRYRFATEDSFPSKKNLGYFSIFFMCLASIDFITLFLL